MKLHSGTSGFAEMVLERPKGLVKHISATCGDVGFPSPALGDAGLTTQSHSAIGQWFSFRRLYCAKRADKTPAPILCPPGRNVEEARFADLIATPR